MDIQVNRTSVCAADDSIMAMGRVFSIDDNDDLNDLIKTLTQHIDFAMICPKDQTKREIWHLQVGGKVIATTTGNIKKFGIEILDAQPLHIIFYKTKELYLKRDLQAMKAYESTKNQHKESDRIKKAIARHRAKGR